MMVRKWGIVVYPATHGGGLWVCLGLSLFDCLWIGASRRALPVEGPLGYSSGRDPKHHILMFDQATRVSISLSRLTQFVP